MKRPVTVTAVWIRRAGLATDQFAKVELLVEINGRFRLCATELLDSNFSHIVEGWGIEKAPIDPLHDAPKGVER